MVFNLLLLLFIGLCLLSLAIAGKSFAPWVPTWKKDLPRIFKLAALKPGEIFYELGCGSGKVTFYAYKNFKIKAIGIELAIPLYFYCRLKRLLVKNNNQLVFLNKNLFKVDLSKADAVYFFGMPNSIKNKLKQKLTKELKPGARVISYVFPIPGWQPKIIDKPNKKDIAIYLYEMS